MANGLNLTGGSNGLTADLSNLFATTVNNWMTAPTALPDVFSLLRRVAIVSICPECNDVSSPPPHKIKCEFCDREYEGERTLKKVTIAGEEIVVPVQEGKCSSCGCHNMDRISAIAKCDKCGREAIHYMPKHRPEEQLLITYDHTHTTPAGTAADWIPYVTIGTPTTYDVVSTSASTAYTYVTA